MLLMTSLSKGQLPVANISPSCSKEPGSRDALGPAECNPSCGGLTSVAEEALCLLLSSSWDHCPHQVVNEGNQDDQEEQYLCLPDQKRPTEGLGI